ncbi:uncharacterized protein LOC118183318 isoform X3 [Stegodyphus dumicola]|uniref:uncharacterized protein LOC118183318 isoform X3 n=1 Tax=Stegodyphus dumicola TaxID=202533 RepID=UPI0015B0B92D|nr:uncharacterized protein LOC118183318 isoform X3 [Stegodyphus dumicola]
MQQSKPPEGKAVPMINSFLNLCRVCPVPTDDKVNSEYKRNFTWHDGYQATKVDVVRNAPSLPSAEPSLSRKKKYIGQLTRDHLLYDKDEGESSDSLEIGSQLGLTSQESDSRARSEERNHTKNRASPRSRSADSTISRRLKATPISDEDIKAPSKAADDSDSRKMEEKQPLMSQSYPPSTNPRGNPGTPDLPDEGVVPKTTEYRSQFVAWPRPPGESCVPTARKSASMGLIAPQFLKKDAVDGEVPSGELWNAMPDEDDDDAALDAVKRGRIKKTEYKSKFRPFSAYTYVDGSWKKATRLIKDRAVDDMDIYSSYSYPLIDGHFTDSESASEADQHAWYSEVVERLKKADQYRARSHTGAPLYGSEQLPLDLLVRDRTILSPVSVASSSREEHSRSREGSTKKKSQVEKTTVRPKSAEPVIPVAKSEHKSPKRTRPRAPKDLPVHGHGDLSGRKKAYKQSTEKSSPVGMKPRAVPRPQQASDDGKVWMKPDSKEEAKAGDGAKEEEQLVNGFASEESETGKMVNGEGPDEQSVQQKMREDAKLNGEHYVAPLTKPPMKVPLTTVKSPEEVTGVRSPDPESWTVPLEIGKGLHWMDGKTPDGVQAKGPPILLSKRLKESSLVGKSQKDIVICDPGSETTGESVDL